MQHHRRPPIHDCNEHQVPRSHTRWLSITAIAFSDDIVLLGDDPSDVTVLLTDAEASFRKRGMTLNYYDDFKAKNKGDKEHHSFGRHLEHRHKRQTGIEQDRNILKTMFSQLLYEMRCVDLF